MWALSMRHYKEFTDFCCHENDCGRELEVAGSATCDKSARHWRADVCYKVLYTNTRTPKHLEKVSINEPVTINQAYVYSTATNLVLCRYLQL